MTETSQPIDERQLGVRPLQDYQVIVDVRTPGEYADDHVPGAINLPLVSQEQFAEVGTLYKADVHRAYIVGAAHALRCVADHIDQSIASYKPGDQVLVYCFRGGKKSNLFATILRAIGFKTDVIPGGWKAYRRWVNQNIETVVRSHRYRVVAGLTGSGKTRLLAALQRRGAQVLDLEGIAVHRGSLLGAVPGVEQPPQKQFDSLVFDQLRRFKPSESVWLESESQKIGRIAIPKALHELICSSPRYIVESKIADRVELLHQEYPNYAANLDELVQVLETTATELLGRKEVSEWRRIAEIGDSSALFQRIMEQYYDPLYRRSSAKGHNRPADIRNVKLSPLDDSALDECASELMAQDSRDSH